VPFDPAVAREPFAYLTTTGRRSGLPREVEIWFALLDGGMTVVVMCEAPTAWYRNLQADPRCTVRIGATSLPGRAEVPPAGSQEERDARAALVARHGGEVEPGDPWREAGLPVLVRV
jgi:deazaflavin-dependent oxidoreductase (nitroreductase family)